MSMVKIRSKLKLKTKTVQEEIKMKRKVFSMLLVMVMGISLLTGCGGNSNENKDNDTIQSSDNVQEGTTVENSEIEEKEEIDTSIYSEKIELTTGEGKVVSIYYDPASVTNLSGADWTGKEEINLGEMMSIYVTDAESAKAYVDTVIDDNGGNIDIGKQEEIQLSGYTIHYFTLNEPESGAFLDKIWLIELDSDVVCRFIVIGEVAEGSQLEKELEAIKFVVGDGNSTESNQNDNKDVEIEGVKPGVATETPTVGNEWPVFLPERPDAFEVLEVTVDQENNVTHYSIDVGVVDYQTVKDYVDEIKNAGCDLENGIEKYSEEGGYINFEGVLDNHLIGVYYDVEWNIFDICIGE